LEPFDLTQFPKEYHDYFFKGERCVVVERIEEAFSHDSVHQVDLNRFYLNGGKSNGIREGMTFYSKIGGCCVLKITESSEDKSTGWIELCPYSQDACEVGDTLRNETDYGKRPTTTGNTL